MKSFLLVAALAFSTVALADIAKPPPEAPAEAAPALAPPANAAPTPAPAPLHPQGIENAVPMGVIDGGWGYVYACYALAIGGTLLYGISLFLRRPSGPPPASGEMS
jgi:hypothetical protein